MELYFTSQDRAFTPGMGAALKTAMTVAHRRRRTFVELEDLLAALVVRTDRSAARLFALLAPGTALVKDNATTFAPSTDPRPIEVLAGQEFKVAMALEFALQEMNGLGHDVLTTAHLAAALADFQHPVGHVLREAGVTAERARHVLREHWAEFREIDTTAVLPSRPAT